MTRTPPDMETEMSETTPRPWSTDPEAGAPDIIYGADFTVLALANADNMAKRVADAELIVKAVNALSTLGDPVVVAEALPELVEAALYMRAKRVEHGGGDEEDGIFENDVRCFDAAYAKLKARP